MLSSYLAVLGQGCLAQDAAPPATEDASAAASTVVIAAQKTRSSVAVTAKEIQTLLPGTNPLRALETLPGVSFQTADPWGNNEQNLSLYIHGFNGQQLGYTLDGIPLGDQQYGNYNGLSPQRAIISENLRSVVLSSGAGDLGTASTSNLGGTIETFSSDPRAERALSFEQTLGSHSAQRTFLRADTGEFGDGNAVYASYLRQRANAWDFDAHQGGDQFNAKWVRKAAFGKFVAYFDYSDKDEPNEDSTVHVANETSSPYTRPFLYPNFVTALAYLSPSGAPPAADGANYHNYFGVAHRRDYLGYLQYTVDISDKANWNTQIYSHHDDGFGAVAGPIGVAGLPGLFAVYYPGQNLKQVFGDSGYAVRTTEYHIKRYGLLSTLRMETGAHHWQFGVWVEHNQFTADRRWYPLDVNAPITPYDTPSNPRITQYENTIDNHVVQLHVQDEWKLRDGFSLTGGFKSSLQFADGQFPVQPALGAISGGSTALPVGEIITKKWFLPQIGAVWDLSPKDQLFANVQKNLRQYITYGAGAASPWSLASQSAFNLFRDTAQPETSVTYELGWRANRTLEAGALTAIDGQISIYHVDFSNRLLQISPTPVIQSIIGGNPILANVGSVKTDGIDIAGTLHFGRNFSLYNALSYNNSTYADNYYNGATLVQTSGKAVPDSPIWMDKLVLTANFGRVQAQLFGDYIGKRYATYTNDLAVSGYFIANLALSATLDAGSNSSVRNLKLSLNMLNLNQERGASTITVGAASGTYNTFPIAPRQVFLTLTGEF